MGINRPAKLFVQGHAYLKLTALLKFSLVIGGQEDLMVDESSKMLLRAAAAHIRRQEILAFRSALSVHLASIRQAKTKYSTGVEDDDFCAGHA